MLRRGCRGGRVHPSNVLSTATSSWIPSRGVSGAVSHNSRPSLWQRRCEVGLKSRAVDIHKWTHGPKGVFIRWSSTLPNIKKEEEQQDTNESTPILVTEGENAGSTPATTKEWRWAGWVSSAKDVESAVKECVERIKPKLGNQTPDLCLVFSTHDNRIPSIAPRSVKDPLAWKGEQSDKIPALLQEYLQPKVLLGSSSWGVLGKGLEVGQKRTVREKGVEIANAPALSIIAATLPGVDLFPFWVQTASLPDLPGFDWAAHTLRKKGDNAKAKETAMMILTDGTDFPEKEFMQRLDFALPMCHKFGGAALGDNVKMFIGNKTLSVGAIGLVMQGDFRLAQINSEGFSPLGDPLRVTKCINRGDKSISLFDDDWDDDDDEEDADDQEEDNDHEDSREDLEEDFGDDDPANLVMPRGFIGAPVSGHSPGEGLMENAEERSQEYLRELQANIGEIGEDFADNLMTVLDKTRSKCIIFNLDGKGLVDIASKWGYNLRSEDQREEFLELCVLGLNHKGENQDNSNSKPPSSFVLKSIHNFITSTDDDDWDTDEIEDSPRHSRPSRKKKKEEEEDSQAPGVEDFLVLDDPVELGDWVRFYKKDRRKGLLDLKERLNEKLGQLLPPTTTPPTEVIAAPETEQHSQVGVLGFSSFGRSLYSQHHPVRDAGDQDLYLDDDDDDEDEDEDDDLEAMAAKWSPGGTRGSRKELEGELEELDKLYERFETLRKRSDMLITADPTSSSLELRVARNDKVSRARAKSAKRRIRGLKKKIERQLHDADMFHQATADSTPQNATDLTFGGMFVKTQYAPLQDEEATSLHQHIGSFVLILPPLTTQQKKIHSSS